MKFSLGKKMSLCVIIISVILSLNAVIMGFARFQETLEDYYKTMAYNLVKTAASQLNAGDVDYYLETLTKDEAYNRQLETLHDIRECNDILYLYVVSPKEEGSYFVWDTDESAEGSQLGDFIEYYDGAFLDNKELFLKGEEVEPIISRSEYGWLVSVFYPLQLADGSASGYVCADISIDKIKSEQIDFLIKMIQILLITTVVLTTFMLVFMRKILITPINRLEKAAGEFVKNKNEGGDSVFAGLSIHTGDEIQRLLESFQKMEEDIYDYINNITSITAEKERIGTELNVATQIQADMLPSIFPPFPDKKEIDIYATMTPAKEVGGDFYDFFLIDEDHLALVMADVSGKGVPAALFMMISKTLLKNAAQNGLSPKAVLEHVNNQLCENNKADMFVTVWLGIMKISTGKMICSNAGHEFPVIKRFGGDFELLKDPHGFVLAGMEDMVYSEYEVNIGKGDRIYVYTDGVPEATNASEELYGLERMLDALNRYKDAPLEKLLEGVKQDVDDFVGDAQQFDDITMLALELREV